MKYYIKKYFLLILFVVTTISCHGNEKLIINNSHLDYLYEEIVVDGKEMAIIHIYSDYPDYTFVGDDDEGIACVDDVARAAVYYLYDWEINSEQSSIDKNKKLLEFVLYLQSDNGYFYNFIWDDYSINRDFKTSVAEPNWWSWRALWALMESYVFYNQSDPVFAERIFDSIEKLISAVKKDIPLDYEYDEMYGFTLPTWLPQKYASDQTAILLLGLIEYYKETKDTIIYNYIKKLCDGIVAMQLKDEAFQFNGAFLSWQNQWHAWGNLQSYALLKCYPILNDEAILNSVLYELDNFYAFLIQTNYLNYFNVEKTSGNLSVIESEGYSQIAYNIRPMVYALLEAYKVTNKDIYAELAAEAAKWLTGRNPANAVMYNKDTGRIFDGINSESEVNKNSGAESTIEGLLTLLKLKENERALKYFLSDN